MTVSVAKSWVRPPAVAGTFYPAEPVALAREVREYLAAGRRLGPTGAAPVAGAAPPAPKALIAPHAGYIYSGPIAGSAYAALAAAGPEALRRITRVVLLGPAHRVGFAGLAASSAAAFATPLGVVPVDAEGTRLATGLPFVTVVDQAHAREHALEVQLPFLQVVLSGATGDLYTPATFRIVPLAVGEVSGAQVGEVMQRLWGGSETLFVVSSDLSHYQDYQTAGDMDRATSAAIEALRPEDIGPDQACGRLAIQGLLAAAPRHGLRARTVDLRNSGDTAGPRQEVVGYGAYIFA